MPNSLQVYQPVFSGVFLNVFGDQSGDRVIVFHDNFDHNDGSAIVGTTPDIKGTSWLSLFDNIGGSLIISSSEVVHDIGISGGAGELIHANYGTVGSADVEIIGVMSNISSDPTQLGQLVARYFDSGNFITVSITKDATEKMRLYKIVTNTRTLLGTSTNIPSDGDTIMLQVIEDAWKVINVTTGITEISVTEPNLSVEGKSGYGVGNIDLHFPGTGAGQVAPSCSQFIVKEF